MIDPEHVEALVARGALYANKGNLERAIEDFEKALEYDKHHKNGRKYMCETLLELGRYVCLIKFIIYRILSIYNYSFFI